MLKNFEMKNIKSDQIYLGGHLYKSDVYTIGGDFTANILLCASMIKYLYHYEQKLAGNTRHFQLRFYRNNRDSDEKLVYANMTNPEGEKILQFEIPKCQYSGIDDKKIPRIMPIDKIKKPARYYRSAAYLLWYDIAKVLGLRENMIAAFDYRVILPLDHIFNKQEYLDTFTTTAEILNSKNLENDDEAFQKALDLVYPIVEYHIDDVIAMEKFCKEFIDTSKLRNTYDEKVLKKKEHTPFINDGNFIKLSWLTWIFPTSKRIPLLVKEFKSGMHYNGVIYIDKSGRVVWSQVWGLPNYNPSGYADIHSFDPFLLTGLSEKNKKKYGIIDVDCQSHLKKIYFKSMTAALAYFNVKFAKC